jgi:aarF domain-containing kinase
MFRKTIKYAALGYLSAFTLIKGFEMLDRSSIFSQTMVPYVTLADGFLIRAPRTFGTFAYVYLNHISHHKYYTMTIEESKVDDIMIDVNIANATTLLNLCIRNGGVWIKFGQTMASLRGLLPEEYADILKDSFDLVPHVDFSEISELFVQDFGHPVSKLFKTFDTKAIAAASLAQVHMATLLDGREVAVKVQYPKVKYYYKLDLKISEILRRITFTMNKQEVRSDIDELLGKKFESELDFTLEAENAMRAKKNFASVGDDVYVPEVYRELSSPRILTMEYIHGFKGNDVDGIKKAGMDISVVATQLFTGIAQQIFQFGHVHADPHPGNFFVRRNPTNQRKSQVVLIDHGLYSELTDEFRLAYSNFWNALVLNDEDRIKEYCTSIGINNWSAYATVVKAVAMDTVGPQLTGNERIRMRRQAKMDRPKDSVATEAQERRRASRMADRENFLQNVPKEMFLLVRTNFILRGVNQVFGCPVNRFNIFARVATYEYNKSLRITGWWGSIVSLKNMVLFEFALKVLEIYTFFLSLLWTVFGREMTKNVTK